MLLLFFNVDLFHEQIIYQEEICSFEVELQIVPSESSLNECMNAACSVERLFSVINIIKYVNMHVIIKL